MILTILSDADSVISTMQADDGARKAAPAGRVWLQMSTMGEAGTDRAMALARAHELQFVDAPVLGTKQPAQEGKLVVLASGPDELHEPCVDPRLLLDAVGGGPLDMPYLQMKGQAMIERSFEPSFALRLAAKDASLVRPRLTRTASSCRCWARSGRGCRRAPVSTATRTYRPRI